MRIHELPFCLQGEHFQSSLLVARASDDSPQHNGRIDGDAPYAGWGCGVERLKGNLQGRRGETHTVDVIFTPAMNQRLLFNFGGARTTRGR